MIEYIRLLHISHKTSCLPTGGPSSPRERGRDSCLRAVTCYKRKRLLTKACMECPGGGHSHTLLIRVCAAQRGRDFEAPDLERDIHFRGVF